MSPRLYCQSCREPQRQALAYGKMRSCPGASSAWIISPENVVYAETCWRDIWMPSDICLDLALRAISTEFSFGRNLASRSSGGNMSGIPTKRENMESGGESPGKRVC